MNERKKEKAKKAINKMIAQEYAPKPLIYKVRLIDNEVAEIPVFAHPVSNGAFENWTKKEFELYETLHGKITDDKRKIKKYKQ